ncbi:HNH endonuclease [Candidatus Nanohalobium constans]|uniref:HNH endonuclease n=1 Tax=Candidatus Nanohalobium constans TaxID=2565781 RepID=A0A5Q0UH21_9ARCH|nr:HNH endonuclease [Candidatus Nanohalobium constans]
MSSRKGFKLPAGKNYLIFQPVELVYWILYLSMGWAVHLFLYLYRRGFMVFHDMFFSILSGFNPCGSILARLEFLLRSRIMNPRSFYHVLKNNWNSSDKLSEDWDSIRKNVLQRDNYCCRVCGAENLELHVDHIVPRKWNGPHSECNLRTLCRHCHRCRHFRKF